MIFQWLSAGQINSSWDWPSDSRTILGDGRALFAGWVWFASQQRANCLIPPCGTCSLQPVFKDDPHVTPHTWRVDQPNSRLHSAKICTAPGWLLGRGSARGSQNSERDASIEQDDSEQRYLFIGIKGGRKRRRSHLLGFIRPINSSLKQHERFGKFLVFFLIFCLDWDW